MAEAKNAPVKNAPASNESKSKNEKTTITFIKPSGRYSRNDTATFPAKTAQKYVDAKVAVVGKELPKNDDKSDLPA